MSLCLDTTDLEKVKDFKLVKSNSNGYVFKSNRSISKTRCNKALKRKLKKYKLRKDGKEDQEIIDVSQIFITALTIKSPKDQIRKVSENNSKTCDIQSSQIVRSFKMGRKKKDTSNIKSVEAGEKNSTATLESEIDYTDKQNKKQTDAFKMLMESRSKVIGVNSPGKDRKEEINDVQELVEKKEIKAKRVLSLQKLAKSRGSLQQQEKEELREIYVKDKMDKRAERLKNMLSMTEKNSCKKIKKSTLRALDERLLPVALSNVNSENTLNKNGTSASPIKPPKPNNGINSKGVSREDIEFLKKLSPSLKKKENMLCYFNVVTKDEECCIEDSQSEINNTNDERIIKVKFTKKSKKKKKIAHVDDIAVTVPNLTTELSDTAQQEDRVQHSEISVDRQKRKRKKQIHETEPNTSLELVASETRPKRNIKKPVKYADDCLSVSSDEELHIFTPKKKKKQVNDIVQSNKVQDCEPEQVKPKENEHVVSKEQLTSQKTIKQSIKNKLNVTSSNISKPVSQDKKPSKLAPIFTAKSQVEELKAKQKFLHSGIPNHLKKCSSNQIVKIDGDGFQKVIHVQQITLKHEGYNGTLNSSYFADESYSDETQNVSISTGLFKNLLMQDIGIRKNIQNADIKIDTLLFSMKQLYPKFPVYRTYHSLKAKSRGEFCNTNYGYLDNSIEIVNGVLDTCNNSPDKFNWTDKYKATSTNQLIGNFESVKELKKWLISWTETDLAVKNDSDSSDFFHSDTDSGDALRMKNNLLILTGKTGSGKTSSVYTVALELSIKVIEVNASSKRTGKIMLQDLQEATQSHKVDRQRDITENSQKSVENEINPLKKNKKAGRPKKKYEEDQKQAFSRKVVSSESISSQDSLRTVMSLILIDDADVVFEQDEGFCSAISQLVHSSKRPVILVTESLQCPHLQKFLKYSKIINMHPFLPRILGTWLDIMCLAENNICYPGLGAKILDLFKGDIRKSINCLQYYMTSQKYLNNNENASQENDFFDKHDDDESSSMSWAVNENIEEKAINYCNDACSSNIQYFMSKLLNFKCQSSTLSFNMWWSLPHLFSQNLDRQNENKLGKKNVFDLEALSNTFDTFSMIDLLEPYTTKVDCNITSKPWLSTESFSLLDTENFTCYDKNDDIKKDISSHLMSSSIEYAQGVLECKQNTELQFPSMMFQRERDKVVGRHKNLASFLNPSVVLDRKAVWLDYLSSCRTICRVERTKTDVNSKRNNRFCHYLKSLNIVCKNDNFDELAKSLCVDNKS